MMTWGIVGLLSGLSVARFFNVFMFVPLHAFAIAVAAFCVSGGASSMGHAAWDFISWSLSSQIVYCAIVFRRKAERRVSLTIADQR